MKPKKIFVLAIALSFSFNNNSEEYPWLSELDYQNEVFESGERLMQLDYGLHALEQKLNNENSLIIAVHGSRSRGYEWVYPLQILDNPETLTSFFRWNDKNCPGPSYSRLKSSIDSMLETNPSLTEVVIIGHSYGALLVSMFLSEWTNDASLSVHTIAGPLAGIASINSLCSYSPPSSINNNVEFYEWRTIKELDVAFKDLDSDPQVINLPGSNVKRLPETYNGRRLGHNWSISWVAEEISK